MNGVKSKKFVYIQIFTTPTRAMNGLLCSKICIDAKNFAARFDAGMLIASLTHSSIYCSKVKVKVEKKSDEYFLPAASSLIVVGLVWSNGRCVVANCLCFHHKK